MSESMRMKEYESYIERIKRWKGNIIKAKPPCCEKEMEYSAPLDEESVWTSTHECPNCGMILWKTSTKDDIKFEKIRFPKDREDDTN